MFFEFGIKDFIDILLVAFLPSYAFPLGSFHVINICLWVCFRGI